MRTKATLAWFRALLVITALLLGQVQVALASEAASEPPAATASEAPPGAAAALALPDEPVNGDKIYVNTWLISGPLPSGAPDATLGHGQAYGASSVVEETMSEPYVTKTRGTTLSWFTVLQNSTGDVWGEAQALMGVEAEVVFSVDGGAELEAVSLTSADLTFEPPAVSPDLDYGAYGEIAWAVFEWTIPDDFSGERLHIRTRGVAEAELEPFEAGYDVVDVDDDYVNIGGPNFDIISFTPDPTEAVPGQQVDFTIVIQNTGDNDITGISVLTPDGYEPDAPSVFYFRTACSDLDNWGTPPFGGPLPGGVLAADAFAQCEINDVPIPSDPAPESFNLTGVVEVSDGTLTRSRLAESDAVNVIQPDIDISKQVLQIRRGGTTVDPPAQAGDVITYEITVTNTGEVALESLWIIDSLYGPIDATGVVLDPLEEWVQTYTHTVQTGSQDPLENTVRVEAEPVEGGNTVDATSAAAVDIADSVLQMTLQAVDPDTGDPVVAVTPPQEIRYRMILVNNGTANISGLDYVAVSPPLQTVGTPPEINPSSLSPGGQVTETWLYEVTEADPDPLTSTVRVRGTVSGGSVVYAQEQVTVDISNPDIGIDVMVLQPDTPTVLRGGDAVYEITVTNKNSVNPICNVTVDQYKRDPDTGDEVPIQLDIAMSWPGTDGRLEVAGSGDETATGVVTYLVTGSDKDPLEMIFEVTSDADCSGGGPGSLSDRTKAVLDVSDAQVNADLSADVGADGVALVGEEIDFTFQAQNVGAVTIENVTATYCIPHVDPTLCDEPFGTFVPMPPDNALAAFDTATGTDSYVIQAVDADASPFLIEAILYGTDNQGNNISIRTATTVAVGSPDLLLELTAPESAVNGDTETFSYTVTNTSGVELQNVRVYNMASPDPGNPYGYTQVGSFGTLPDNGQESGNFTHPVEVPEGEPGDVFTMHVRALADYAPDTYQADALADVALVPMIVVEKSGPPAGIVAGQPVEYEIAITNNSTSQSFTVTGYEDTVLAEPPYNIPIEDSDFGETLGSPGVWPGGVPGVLPPESTVVGAFTIASIEPEPNPLENVFTVTGTRDGGVSVVASDSHSFEIGCPIQFNFNVTNIDDYPADILGEELQWQISFTNISGATIDNITISETLNWPGEDPLISWPDTAGQLAPGQSASLDTFNKMITNEYYEEGSAGVMSDELEATFSETGGATNCQQTYEYGLSAPLLLRKLPDPFVAFVGDEVEYTIRVENRADADENGYENYYVTVYDTLLQPNPILLDYNGDGTLRGTGWMEPGEVLETTLTRKVVDSDPDELENVLTAEYPDPTDPDVTFYQQFAITIFTSNPLQITKTPNAQQAVPGTDITYDYTITNVSPYTVEQITLTDTLIGELIPLESATSLAPNNSISLTDVEYPVKLTDPDPLINTATVKGTVVIPDGENRDVSNAITVAVDLQDPDVTLTKSVFDHATGDPLPDNVPLNGDGVPEAIQGQAVDYCFEVTNNADAGGSPTPYVENIQLEDPFLVPSGTPDPTPLQQQFETALAALGNGPGGEPRGPAQLFAGETVSFCFVPESGEPIFLQDSMGDPVVNLATITGISSNGIEIYDESEVVIDLIGQNILITKLPSQSLAYIGETVTYTIRIENTNLEYDIVDMVVTDSFLGGAPSPIPLDADAWDWSHSGIDGNPPGELAAVDPGTGQGGYATYSYNYTVDVTDPDPLTNVASVTGYLNDDPDPASRTDVDDSTRASVAITASQLLIRKTAVPNVAQPGDTVRYTITITNIGAVTVYNLTATDVSPLGELTFSGNDLSDDTLSPYESAFATYEQTMPSLAELQLHPEWDPFINTLTAEGIIFDKSGNPLPPVTAQGTESVDIRQPNLRIVKSPVEQAATQGQTVTYNITITNTGGDPLTSLVLTDITDGNQDVDLTTFVYGSEPYTDENGDGIPETPNPKEGTSYAYDPLESREQLLGSITVQVPPDYEGSEFTNVVEIRAQNGPDTVRDRASATIDIRDEGVEVEKLASDSGAPVGSPVEYTVRVTNIGGIAIARLVIADAGMPSGSVRIDDGFPDDPDTPDDDSDTLDADEGYTHTYEHVLSFDDGDPYVNRATVTAYTETGTALVSVGEATVDVQSPRVAVEKTACAGPDDDGDPATINDPCGSAVNYSDIITYYLHISNPSEIPLRNFTVTDTLVDDSTFDAITWPAADDGLGAGDEVWFTYEYTPQPGDPDPITNRATVTGYTFDDPPVEMQSSDTAAMLLAAGDLQLAKSAVDQAAVGDTVTYTLTASLSDTASAPVTGVEIFDPLSGSTDPICGPFDLNNPGDALGCTFDHTVTLADGTPLVNTATAVGSQGGAEISDTASHTLEVITEAGLSVSKTASPAVVAIGDTVTFTYRVENTGPVTIGTLTVSDSDPAIDFSSNPWPDSLLPGQEVVRTATRTITAQDPDPYTNTVTVSAVSGTETITAEATETVYVSNADLVVSNTPNTTYAQPGEPITFTYTVTNLGGDTIDGLSVSDNIGGDFTLSADQQSLASGESLTLYRTVTAALPGPMLSTVYAQATSPTTVFDTASAEVAVTEGGLVVSKTADRTAASDGDVVTYTVQVTNVGTEDLTDFTVDDPNVMLSPAPPETLAVGASFSMTGTVTVGPDSPSSLANTVTVTATGVNTSAQYSDSDSAAVAVLENPSATLSLMKSVDKPHIRVDGTPAERTLTYTLRVQNIGTTVASNITLEDPPGSQIATLDPLAPGNVALYTYSVTVPSTHNLPIFENAAEVLDDGTMQDTAAVAVTVQLVEMTKTPVDVSGVAYTGQTVYAGETVTYEFTLTNLSDATVNDVLLEDPGVEFYMVLDDPDDDLTPELDDDLTINSDGTVTGFMDSDGATVMGRYTLPVALDDLLYDVDLNPDMVYENTAEVSVDEVWQAEASALVDVSNDVIALSKVVTEVSGAAYTGQTAYAGQALTYEFTLTNRTNEGINGVDLIDDNPDLTWLDPVLEPLPPGVHTVKGTYLLPLDLNDPMYDDGEFRNTARVEVNSVPVDGAEAEATITITDDVLMLTKETIQDSVAIGGTIDYIFTITNLTPISLYVVELSDPQVNLDGTTTWDASDPLASGENEVFGTFTLPPPSDPSDPLSDPFYSNLTDGAFENTAQVMVNSVQASEATVSVPVRGLEVNVLDVTQDVGDGTPRSVIQTGEPAQLSFEITNTGLMPINDLTHTLSLDITTSEPVACQNDPLPDALEPLDVGQTETVTCEFTVPAGLDETQLQPMVEIEVSGTSDGTAVSDTDSAEIQLVDAVVGAQLLFDGTTEASVLPGSTVTLQVVLSNEGGSPIGCSVSCPVGDPVPCEPCQLSVTSPDAVFNDVLAFRADEFANTVLAPGEQRTFNIDPSYPVPDVSTTYNISVAGGYAGPLVPEEDYQHYIFTPVPASADIIVLRPEIAVTVGVTPNPPIIQQAVTYTVTVENTGPIAVENLTGTYQINPLAAAPIQDGIMLVSAPRRQGSGTLTFPSTTIPVGGSVSATVSTIEDHTVPYVFRATVNGTGEQATGPVDGTADLTITPQGTGTATPTVDPATLDPTATEPVVTKEADTETAQVGGTITWTITVRNSSTGVMNNVTMQDNVPQTLTIESATTDSGAVVPEGQLVTASAATMNPGDTITVTLVTSVNEGATSPSNIANTACALRGGGERQVCETASVSVGPDAGTLPATGINSTGDGPLGWRLEGLFGVMLVGALMLLMSSATGTNRRTWLAVLFVLIAAVAVVVAVALLMAQDGDEAEEETPPAVSGGDTLPPTDTPEPPDVGVQPSDTPEPDQPSATPEASATTAPTPEGILFDFPPTPTPYTVREFRGNRALEIPRLAEQFDVPVQIMNLPIVNNRYEINSLRYGVGWLEGTTWLDPDWGNTVLAAHVQFSAIDPGPFYGLDRLEPGDEIIVHEGDERFTFIVQRRFKVAPDDMSVTAPTADPTLTLITCTEWDQNYGLFSQRLVVQAVPVENVAPAG